TIGDDRTTHRRGNRNDGRFGKIFASPAGAWRADYGDCDQTIVASTDGVPVRAGLFRRPMGGQAGERVGMNLNRNPYRKLKSLLLSILPVFAVAVAQAQTNDSRSLILVVGAAGDPDYTEPFSRCAEVWKQAAAKGGLQTVVIGEDKEKLEQDLPRLL